MTATLEEPVGAASAPGTPVQPVPVRAAPSRASNWLLALIVAAAAALRLTGLGGVASNEFYDAAVRSMGLSAHNFLFGAFDPAAILSIDKPPLDLWLQVLSVKLLGFSSFALKLPEALGGTLAVPLLYDCVRRMLGRPAALGAACALAVLPESVLSSRSDTMDSVMMLLVLAALWMMIRVLESGERRHLVLAGVALGLAFNVKLLEALVAAPALVTLYVVGSSVPVQRKLAELARAAAALVGVGLAWAAVVSLAPGRHPWAVGSSDGSVWDAMFVFNGFGKISHAPSTKPGGPGLFRLAVSTGWHYDVLFGCALVAALALGGAALVREVSGRRRETGSWAWVRASAPQGPGAFVVATAVWIVTGIVVFDSMGTVHARYLEAFAPAVAVAIGAGAVSLAGLVPGSARIRRPSTLAGAVALTIVCAYAFALGSRSSGWAAVSLLVAAAGAALIVRAGGVVAASGRWLVAGLITACALVFPAHESVILVRTHENDSLGLAALAPGEASALSRFLWPRTTGLRYELAVDEPLALAPLIIHDQRPILPLTSFGGRPLSTLAEVRAAVRSGQVRYGLVEDYPCSGAGTRAGCGPAARWIRSHGIDVSRQAGITGSSRLYELTPERAA
ncbi:MAG: glycosyltransferase family 39 protein [Solirubrobacteraceae bacterium]